MNLFQVIRSIESAAAAQPVVGTIVRNDVFRLNAAPAVHYGVFAWLQGEHMTGGDSNIMRWAFTLFYVDRLTSDKGNEVEIQSTGIEVLENVLRQLEQAGAFAGDYSFQTFNQRFTDECAGVFCRVVLETAKDAQCEVEYTTAPVWNDGGWWEWTTGDRTIKII
jgi:hypothetical protein